MAWFRREPDIHVNLRINGLGAGDIVQHKISKERYVTRGFRSYEGEWWAVISGGVYRDDELEAPVVELEAASTNQAELIARDEAQK